MIYTVTFNPSLDYIVTVDDFRLGMTNRTTSELMLPGGKGINVSIVLSNLGIENTAFYFAAGFVGDEITRRVTESGIRAEAIPVGDGCSRINLKLKSIAQEEGMNYVYVGNVMTDDDSNTFCPECGKLLIRRTGYRVDVLGLEGDKCAFCRHRVNIIR